MKARTLTPVAPIKSLALAALLTLSATALAEPLKPLVDDFATAGNNSLGLQRQYISDSVAGGASTMNHTLADGVLTVSGEIVPARGQLGWTSCALPLNAQGLAQNAAAYQGVLLRIKVSEGNVSLTVNSTEVTNFDYHAAPLAVPADGQFHEVKVPFSSLQRAWSEQIPLNPSTLNGLSIVAYSPQAAPFEYQLDEVRFY
ncbi:CIA30 family protein [Gilvimarinus algae]|uniref:CIA30 family protein n=1 Tax=Gilvimarinus algae TaxID=3058037 RepID=A0ABT8THW1_9GAMM|nr:CIA30 family protein [Gilvimarinus sp. SDUM040014]MDO3383677.1 CIA30 family protein [Gilvimarinus sp. SDUM040014]